MTTNKDQLNAINTLNKKILVSASAGAGKTTVLINRLIKRIIKDQVKITDIVAMTFTNAAASEMKKRLIIALNNEVNNPNNSNEIKEYAKEQLALSSNANIKTIDSFCLNIIKDGYASINLPIESISNIYTPEQSKGYYKEAFNIIFDKYLETNNKQIYNLNSLLSKNATNFNKLENTILDIVNKSLTQTDPIIWFNKLKSQNKQINSFNDIDIDIMNRFIDIINRHINHLINLIKLVFDDPNYNLKKNEIDSIFNILINAKNSDNLYDKYECLVEFKNVSMSFNKPSLTVFKEYLKEKLTPLIYIEEEYIKDHNSQVDEYNLLIDIAHDVYKEYKHIKLINKGLDFNDMEHYAYDILSANDYELSKVYKNLYKEVMVDEFQDTNELQYQIINLLAEPTNLFMVGDLKQSIYRFRGAKPEIMQRISKQEDTYNITLKNNYRSVKDIVEYNNYLFNRLMNTGPFKIKYEEKDFQIAELDRQFNNNYPICIHNIKEADNTLSISKKDSNIESKFLAQLITNSIENSEFKEYKSYCILVRTNTNVFLLKKYLEQANIPVYIDEKLGYLNTLSISILISYLTILNDISEQISLASVLSSSLYNLDDDLLFKIKDNTLISYLKEIDHPFIKDYYYLKSQDNINNIIDYILNINNFYSEKLNVQEQTNIDLFYQNINNLNTNSLIDVLDYIDNIIEEDKTSAIPISEMDNVCRVMTIHKSKGLQFDVVILMANNTFSNKDANKSLIVTGDYGFANSYSNINYPNTKQSINNIVLNDYIYYDLVEEEVRILYVALTRAKYQLHIIIYDNDKKNNIDKIEAQAKDIFIKDSNDDVFDINIYYKDIINNDIDFRYKYNLLFTCLNTKQEYINKYLFSSYDINDIKDTNINYNIEDNTRISLENIYESSPTYVNMITHGSKDYNYLIYNYDLIDLNNTNTIINNKYNTYKLKKYNYDIEKLESIAPSNHNFEIKLNFTGKNYMQKGTDIHKAFEILPKDKVWTHDIIKELNLEIPEYLYDNIISLQSNNIYINCLKDKHYFEYPFTVKINNKLINGIIDFISINDNEITIIDYKSDNLDDELEFIDRYKEQLDFYRKAMNIIYPNKKIKCYIYALNLIKLIEV